MTHDLLLRYATPPLEPVKRSPYVEQTWSWCKDAIVYKKCHVKGEIPLRGIFYYDQDSICAFLGGPVGLVFGELDTVSREQERASAEMVCFLFLGLRSLVYCLHSWGTLTPE